MHAPNESNPDEANRAERSNLPQVASAADSRDKQVWQALEGVKDPEIPVISVVEMGMIAGVRREGDALTIEFTPTFAGCPALDVIQQDIHRAVSELGEANVVVKLVYHPPWSTDRISDDGRRKLKEFGLSPPTRSCSAGGSSPDGCASTAEPNLDAIPCPFCDSQNTQVDSIFGPTLCRSIHYCNACSQSFEHFKAV